MMWKPPSITPRPGSEIIGVTIHPFFMQNVRVHNILLWPHASADLTWWCYADEFKDTLPNYVEMKPRKRRRNLTVVPSEKAEL